MAVFLVLGVLAALVAVPVGVLVVVVVALPGLGLWVLFRREVIPLSLVLLLVMKK